MRQVDSSRRDEQASERARTGLWLLIRSVSLAALVLCLVAPSAGALGAGRCNKPLSPGLHVVGVQQDGLERPVQVWIPAGYDGRRVPLLFQLHGSGTTGEAMMATVDPEGNPLFRDDADEHGYIVATPNGAIPFEPAPGFAGFAWNIPGVPLVGTAFYPPPGTPDDVAYIGLVIDAISEMACVDESRVYASGASGGGRMASQLACDLSERITAIAPIMGIRAPRATDTPGFSVECEPTRPVPVVAIHGLLDPINLFHDDDPAIVPGSSWTYGVPEAMARWAELNECAPVEPRQTEVTEHVDEVLYLGCRDGAEVSLYEVSDGGHTIPGSAVNPFLIPLIGPTNQELDTPDTIWSFVSRYRLHRRP